MAQENLTDTINTLVRLGEERVQHAIEDRGGRRGFLIPEGYMIDWSDPVDKPLPHMHELVEFIDRNSFAEYIKAFAINTRIFANVTINCMSAFLNYHEDGKTPGYSDNVAILKLANSVEFAAWSDISGKLLPQIEFSEFLEEHAGEIIAPEQADVIEACRNLEVSTQAKFSARINTQSGRATFTYEEDENAKTHKGEVALMRRLTLSIPVYCTGALSGECVQIDAMLRYRVERGELKLGVKLLNLANVRQAAFLHEVDQVSQLVGFPVMLGHRNPR